MKTVGLEQGVIYFSREYEGLNTRDQVPDLLKPSDGV